MADLTVLTLAVTLTASFIRSYEALPSPALLHAIGHPAVPTRMPRKVGPSRRTEIVHDAETFQVRPRIRTNSGKEKG
jgi:hypothetical protein